MGSWYSTCGITQLPIFSGDRVVVFLLKHDVRMRKGTIADGLNYSTDICEPIFLPFRANYNDYGGVENVKKDWNTSLILDWANRGRNIAEAKDKKPKWDAVYLDEHELSGKLKSELSRFHDKPHLQFKDIEEFFEAIERGRVTFENGHVLHAALTYMMIREDVFDALIKATALNVNEERERDKEWNDEQFDFKEQLEQDAEYLLDWIFIAAQKEKDKDNRDYSLDYSLAGCWGRDSTKMKHVYRHNLMASFMAGNHGFSMRYLFRHLKDNAQFLNDKKFRKDLKKHMVEFALALKSVDDLRKLWIPQAGAGSQDQEIDLHVKLAHIVIDVVKAEKQRREDDL